MATTTTRTFVIVTFTVPTMAAVTQVARNHQDPDQHEEPVVPEKPAHAHLPGRRAMRLDSSGWTNPPAFLLRQRVR
jgi:hypothetical protein